MPKLNPDWRDTWAEQKEIESRVVKSISLVFMSVAFLEVTELKQKAPISLDTGAFL